MIKAIAVPEQALWMIGLLFQLVMQNNPCGCTFVTGKNLHRNPGIIVRFLTDLSHGATNRPGMARPF